jgi:hypothetical protein
VLAPPLSIQVLGILDALDQRKETHDPQLLAPLTTVHGSYP